MVSGFLKTAAALAITLAAVSACRGAAPSTALASTEGAQSVDDQRVYHVVAFRFKTDDATRAQIDSVSDAYRALTTASVSAETGKPLIQSFHGGPNNSTEQLSFGVKGVAIDRSTERSFILTFANGADRDEFVDRDPAHQKFKALVGGLLDGGSDGVFVTDFVD